MSTSGEPMVFALEAGRPFAGRVASRLGLALSAHEERDFEDGEHKVRPLESVRGRDVYVVQSAHRPSVDRTLVRLLFFLGALRDAGAARVTAVVPYLPYARKDRQTKPRDPVTTRYVARLFESVGVHRVVVVDVHNLAAFQNAFRCATEHVEARLLFVRRLLPLLGDDPVVVVSPDAGGEKRADRFRLGLGRALGAELPLAFLEKKRSEGVVSGESVVGDVDGRVAVVVDDLVASGTTLVRAARALRERGATRVYAVATHGLFVGDAATALADENLETTFVTDTVAPPRLDRVEVVEAAPLVAEAIRRLHESGSLVDLAEEGGPG